MVVDTAFVVGTLASFLMNGACCAYQMNREGEFRESLRNEIAQEWQEQRQRELEQQQAEHETRMRQFEERYSQVLSRQEEGSYTQTHLSEGRRSNARYSLGKSNNQESPPSVVATTLSTTASSGSHLTSLFDDDDDDDDHEDENKENRRSVELYDDPTQEAFASKSLELFSSLAGADTSLILMERQQSERNCITSSAA